MRITFFLTAALVAGTAHAGPYAPAAGKTGSTAVSKNSTDIVRWATGYSDYLPGATVDAAWKTPEKALGAAVGDAFDIVSLGDKGSITLSFGGSIRNGAGWDFAVFENSFSDTFLELAYVEVSSNGTDFFRFNSVSYTASAVGGFGSIDPTNINNLAGKYRQGYGTPFDLNELAGIANLDINRVQYVRLIDIKGDGSEYDNFPLAYGGPHRIYDPYPTSGTVGFDLDAVGARYFEAAAAPAAPVPEPATAALFAAGLALFGLRALRKN